jgi:cardiolipin synthase A/B
MSCSRQTATPSLACGPFPSPAASVLGQGMRLAHAFTKRWPIARARSVAIVLAAGVLLCAGLGIGFFSCQRDEDDQAFRLTVPIPSEDAAFALALHQSLGVTLAGGHHVSLLDNGAIFDGIEAEVRKAQSSVHVLMYIWEKGVASDRVVRALAERASRGVGCRVLVDAFGSPKFAEEVQPALAEAGCDVRIFRPLPGYGDELARNHRKIVVVDGRIGFTGGFGIRDNWLGDGITGEAWRDANVRFTGPAVTGAQQAFAENWQEAGGSLLPPETFPAPDASGPATAAFVTSTVSPVLTRSERLIQLMIQSARKRLWIANAYFVPSKAILDMIERKASEGVDVRLLAPGKKSDSKTSFGLQHVEYRSLLEKGVRVWEYLPSMMHAKTMVVDDDLASVSSMNLDPLSLTKLEEVALVVKDRAFTATLARTFEIDCSHARALAAD